MEFYLEFIRTVFQAADEQGKLRNRIVAFTSAAPGEGVSHVVNTLAKEIATLTQRRVLAVDSLGLQNLHVTDPHMISRPVFRNADRESAHHTSSDRRLDGSAPVARKPANGQ